MRMEAEARRLLRLMLGTMEMSRRDLIVTRDVMLRVRRVLQVVEIVAFHDWTA
jgi:hypothetical protein